jgi:hypothetical protein
MPGTRPAGNSSKSIVPSSGSSTSPIVARSRARKAPPQSIAPRSQTPPSPLVLVLCATEIPHASIDVYAARLLSVGTDGKVESPPQLIGAMRERAMATVKLYPQDMRPEADAETKG